MHSISESLLGFTPLPPKFSLYLVIFILLLAGLIAIAVVNPWGSVVSIISTTIASVLVAVILLIVFTFRRFIASLRVKMRPVLEKSFTNSIDFDPEDQRMNWMASKLLDGMLAEFGSRFPFRLDAAAVVHAGIDNAINSHLVGNHSNYTQGATASKTSSEVGLVTTSNGVEKYSA